MTEEQKTDDAELAAAVRSARQRRNAQLARSFPGWGSKKPEMPEMPEQDRTRHERYLEELAASDLEEQKVDNATLERYLEDLAKRGRSERTIANYRRDLQGFFEYAGNDDREIRRIAATIRAFCFWHDRFWWEQAGRAAAAANLQKQDG